MDLIKASCSDQLKNLGFLHYEDHPALDSVYYFSDKFTLCITHENDRDLGALYTAAFFNNETADQPDGCSSPDMEELLMELERLLVEHNTNTLQTEIEVLCLS
jgi:hypothetical protein